MEVALSPEFQKFVLEKVDAGAYPSADAVVQEGLRLLKEHDDERFGHLKQQIALGFEDLDAGRYRDFKTDEEAQQLIADIQNQGRERLEQSRDA